MIRTKNLAEMYSYAYVIILTNETNLKGNHYVLHPIPFLNTDYTGIISP